MKTIYVVEYIFTNFTYQHHINQDAWANLDDARKWCKRNGARPEDENEMSFHWVENGDRYYVIHPVTVEGL